jgi:hypothetical protein
MNALPGKGRAFVYHGKLVDRDGVQDSLTQSKHPQ